MIERFFDPNSLTLLPFGLAGNIYRSPMPFRVSDEDDLLFAQYQDAGINVIVVLAERKEIQLKANRDLFRFYEDQFLDVIHCPIPDFSVPDSPDSICDAVRKTHELAGKGKNIVVHCYAGFGRTGLFMGCLAKQILGFSGHRAINWVRNFIPTALENEAQEAFVRQFDPGGCHVD